MITETTALAKQLGELLLKKQLHLATAESCTGGGLAYALTNVPGSSAWFECGIVAYSNTAKFEFLKVCPKIVETYGAISIETAKAMAEGAVRNTLADISIATTGIAGPDGGTIEKPVGTVCFAWTGDGFSTKAAMQFFEGERIKIRDQAIQFAIKSLLSSLHKIR